MRRHHTLSALVALPAGFLLLACGGGGTVQAPAAPPVTTGSLTVTITGLPAAAQPQVAVNGPNFNQTLVASAQLNNLPPGTYQATAASVTAGGLAYAAPTQSATVSAGQTSTLAITYAHANLAPSIPQIVGPSTVTAGVPALFALSSTDPEGDPIVYTLSPALAGASLTGSTLAWTPQNSQVGSQTLRVVATDAGGFASPAGTLVVTVAPAPVVAVSVSPATVFLGPGGTQTFTALVTGAGNTAVTWTASAGALGSPTAASALYTAPAQAGTFSVTATSVADPTKSASASITVAQPGWSPAAIMSTARTGHTATLLGDGRVLVTGGWDGTQELADCQIYHPATNTWAPAAPLPVKMSYHLAVPLPDGRVLVKAFGASGPANQYLSAIYTPATNTWSPTTNPVDGAWAMVAGPDGRVLSLGEWRAPVSQPSYAVAEVYSPIAGQWSETGRFSLGRSVGALLTLADGSPIAIGGRLPDSSWNRAIAVDRYSWQTGTWTPLAPLPFGVSECTGVRLADGGLLVTGGDNGLVALDTALRYDGTGWWMSWSMSTPRKGHMLVALPSGQVLAAGGAVSYTYTPGVGYVNGPATASVDLYSPSPGVWVPSAPMALPRAFAEATLLRDGRVFVTGGRQANPTQVTATCEIYQPSSAPAVPAPIITSQPQSLTVQAGQPATFYVSASGQGMAYQWRKNGAVLPGATASSFQIAVVSQSDAGAYSVVVTNAGGQVLSASAQLTVTAPGPVATTYTTFGGQALPLYAWEGVHTAILTASPGRDPVVMAKLLAAADGTYAYYKAATGYTPGPAKTYNGKLTIAEVPTTCGAGCGYLGATGIELQTGTFAVGYDAVRLNNQYDQAAFYEFGRNFWFLGPRLEYVAPDNSGGAVTTGFAVFMRFMAMDVQGLPGAPYYAWSYPEFRTRVEAMVDLYQADPTQTWSNTLRLGHPQANNPSGLGATDLFASFCFRLRRDYGGDAFIAKLWKEAALRPTAANTQGAVDNFFLASCAAAGRNLTPLFETAWRWPLSAAAKAEAASRFPL